MIGFFNHGAQGTARGANCPSCLTRRLGNYYFPCFVGPFWVAFISRDRCLHRTYLFDIPDRCPLITGYTLYLYSDQHPGWESWQVPRACRILRWTSGSFHSVYQHRLNRICDDIVRCHIVFLVITWSICDHSTAGCVSWWYKLCVATCFEWPGHARVLLLLWFTWKTITEKTFNRVWKILATFRRKGQ